MYTSNVDKVLYVNSHFKTKPGEALISNHFLGVGRYRRWDACDLQDGIEEANERGLVERAEHGWHLTQVGYDEASDLQMAESS